MEGIVHHHHHNQQQQRKRLTLLEQMSVLDTSNLRDQSRVKDNDDGGGRNALVGLTLGAVLGCEVVQEEEERRRGRINPSRTLLDIIKDEESGAAYRGITVRNDDQNNNNNNKNTWKSFKDRLLLRRAGAALTSSSSNSIDDDFSRMEISRPSLTGIPSRSSFSIPTTVTTTAANSSVPATSNTSGIHGMEEEEIVEEINTNSVPAAEPVVMRLATALEAEREEEEQRRQTLETRPQEEDDGLSNTNVVVVGGIGEGGGEQVRMMNDESMESVPSPPPPPLPTGQQQPLRVSLMALLEETDRHSGFSEQPMRLMRTAEQGEEEAEEDERRGGGVGMTVEGGGGGRQEYICCVCMVRHKGAAFIPCGHTFCRICSRKLWVNRGNCPLCNGYILEILDIF